MKTVYVFIGILCVLFWGCATVNIQSVADKSQKYEITNMQLVIDGPNHDIAEEYIQNLSAKMTASGINNTYLVASLSKEQSLSLQPDTQKSIIKQIISESHSPYVMVLAMTHLEMTSSSQSFSTYATAMKFEAVIYYRDANKIIWKGNFDGEYGTIGSRAALYNGLSENIIKQLAKDGLLK
jgi:hypothetical protein